MARSKTGKAAIQSVETLERVLELRVNDGLTLQEVANILGVSRQAVHERIKRYKDAKERRCDELLDAQTQRQHDDIRADIARLSLLIDQVQSVVIATGQDGTYIDTKALSAIVSAFNAKKGFYEREGRLLGLDAAAKSEISGPDGTPVVTGVFAVPLGSVSTDDWAAEALIQSAGEEESAEAILSGSVDAASTAQGSA